MPETFFTIVFAYVQSANLLVDNYFDLPIY
jgi:hypothetical protein